VPTCTAARSSVGCSDGPPHVRSVAAQRGGTRGALPAPNWQLPIFLFPESQDTQRLARRVRKEEKRRPTHPSTTFRYETIESKFQSGFKHHRDSRIAVPEAKPMPLSSVLQALMVEIPFETAGRSKIASFEEQVETAHTDGGSVAALAIQWTCGKQLWENALTSLPALRQNRNLVIHNLSPLEKFIISREYECPGLQIPAGELYSP